MEGKFDEGPTLRPEYFKCRMYFFNKIMINLNRLPTYMYYSHFKIILYTQSKCKKNH